VLLSSGHVSSGAVTGDCVGSVDADAVTVTVPADGVLLNTVARDVSSYP
jgi:hypothetical protein